MRRYINRGWQYNKVFDEQMLSMTYKGEMNMVEIPHTCKTTSYDYFDESEYQMVSGYRKVFVPEDSWKGKKLLLTFEGVAHEATLYINGKQVAYHNTGYTAFTTDITEYIQFDTENVLVVRVDSRETLNIPPFGNVIDYMTYGGIYRDVYIDVKPMTYIRDTFVKPLEVLTAAKRVDTSVTIELEEAGAFNHKYQHSQVMTYKDAVVYEGDKIELGVENTNSYANMYNKSEATVEIDRLLSTQVDLPEGEYVFTSFNGAWAREMNRRDQLCKAGLHINHSVTGTSSNRANPFVMVSKPDASETYGECYGFNLVYSGNHYEALEVSQYGSSRFINGINPKGFGWKLGPNTTFTTPEAIMTYSKKGHRLLSLNMHHFVREHIVRGTWKYKERPILLNNWEATYFKFNESKLLKLASKAKELGVELFVMDDGWFGKRDDNTSSLGDWTVYEKKLPSGIKELAKKIHNLGLDFGIWVEPEMVIEDSECYRLHPEWAVTVSGEAGIRPHSEGRNQMILDLANPEVVDYLYTSMETIFASGDINYVKWDMNRIFSDCYSRTLSADRQKEFSHRYVIGLYQLIERLVTRFPNILFEGCSAGGNRFDLGMLSYMPQIWASDDTDAMERSVIQEGYSYGYPQSTYTNHVSSCPNHQTLRVTPIETRYNMACMGILGYECNVCEIDKEEEEAIRKQIELYKLWRKVYQYGDFYRNGENGDFIIVSPDKSRAVATLLQHHNRANVGTQLLKLSGLDREKKYHFYNIPGKVDVKCFGDLINTMAPIHVKKDSLTHNVIAKYVKLHQELEEYHCQGSVLEAGVRLKQVYSGTGYNEQVRVFGDYASRMYYIEAE